MKNIVLAAAVAALFAVPAFAAPEAFNVDVGPGGQLRASPPTAAAPAQPKPAPTWMRAEAPGGQQANGQMMQASDEQASENGMPGQPKKKHSHKASKKPIASEGANPEGSQK